MDTSDRFDFYRKAGQVAYQLEFDHGHNAPFYAAKLAKEAELEGRLDEAEFWRYVSSSVTTRQANNF